MSFVPSMERLVEGSEQRSITLGHPLVDAYLEFAGARGAVNTWLATAYDLKVFFEVVSKDPADGHPQLVGSVGGELPPDEIQMAASRPVTARSTHAL